MRNTKLFIITLLAILILQTPLFAQQKHALLIGISNYPQYKDADASWAKIHGTNDVQLISPLLAKQGFKIVTLTDNLATHKGKQLKDGILCEVFRKGISKRI